MNSARYVRTLGRHLAGLRATARYLAEARQTGQETATDEEHLRQQLMAYGWAVRNRAWLVGPAYATDGQLIPVNTEELHIRLLALETLVQLRVGQLPGQPTEPTDLSPASPALVQRLATAESRLFHLYQLFPLN